MVSRFERLMGCSSIPIGETLPESNSQCSGRGDCLNGTCLCEIRYSGDECSGFNLPYHAGKCTRNFGLVLDRKLIYTISSLSRRHIFRFLLCRFHLSGTANDLYHRRISEAETTEFFASVSVDNTKVALLLCVYCIRTAGGVLHYTGKLLD